MAGPKTSRQSLQSIEAGMENCETFQVTYRNHLVVSSKMTNVIGDQAW